MRMILNLLLLVILLAPLTGIQSLGYQEYVLQWLHEKNLCLEPVFVEADPESYTYTIDLTPVLEEFDKVYGLDYLGSITILGEKEQGRRLVKIIGDKGDMSTIVPVFFLWHLEELTDTSSKPVLITIAGMKNISKICVAPSMLYLIYLDEEGNPVPGVKGIIEKYEYVREVVEGDDETRKKYLIETIELYSGEDGAITYMIPVWSEPAYYALYAQTENGFERVLVSPAGWGVSAGIFGWVWKLKTPVADVSAETETTSTPPPQEPEPETAPEEEAGGTPLWPLALAVTLAGLAIIYWKTRNKNRTPTTSVWDTAKESVE